MILDALKTATSAYDADEASHHRFSEARRFFENYLDEIQSTARFSPYDSTGYRWSAEISALSAATRFTVALVALRYAESLDNEYKKRKTPYADSVVLMHRGYPVFLVRHILAMEVEAQDPELEEFCERVERSRADFSSEHVVLRLVLMLERQFASDVPARAAAILRQTALRWQASDNDALWQPGRRLAALVDLQPTPPINDDRFPDCWAFELLNRVACDLLEQESRHVKLRNIPSGRAVLELPPAQRAILARRAAAAIGALKRGDSPDGCPPQLKRSSLFREAGALVLMESLKSPTPLSESDLLDILTRTDSELARLDRFTSVDYLSALVERLERDAQSGSLSHTIRTAAGGVAGGMVGYLAAAERRIRDRFSKLAEDTMQLPLEGGEAWADAALREIQAAERRQAAWTDLLAHCGSAPGSAPSRRWSEKAESLIDRIGSSEFEKHLAKWLPLVDKPRTHPLDVHGYPPELGHWLVAESNADVLKGLAWCCGLGDRSGIARLIAALALSAYRKLPGIGPRLVKVGNACIWALGNMPGLDGLSQLAILKTRVKFGTAQKLIEKAIAATAQRLGLPRDEIEEMAVPTYGLDEVGLRSETLGDYKAQLIIAGGANPEVRWFKPDGKPLKSAPAAVKSEHADNLRELAQASKDIQKMLPAQRERIDTLHLAQKTWPLATWRERYRDHPLVGVIARGLIWHFASKERHFDGIFVDGAMVDLHGRPLDFAGDAIVSLWHPIGKSIDEIRAWRAFLEDRQIQQPFKQAHREIYLLTDAERRTRTYSNRYAAHILRQHQFNALCGARGWKNKLRLMVDQEFPPATLHLPKWNLRAEFWIEGVGDEYGADTNETGTYHRVATDQVRFYRTGAAENAGRSFSGGYASRADEPGDADINNPLTLDEIPPLVFSEVMRDADMFVGVASVGNDPTWQDGGPGGHFRDYWSSYAFGALTETAQTRKTVLESLLPRLKIAARCTLEDKFLVVRGDLRTYKIHLGSGNILMKPNDQYLCIVQGRSTGKSGDARVFLPFQGDERLSIILSKALLLAEDTKITDETITRQIRTS